MQLYPTSQELMPTQIRFWVENVDGNIVPTTAVQESPEAVEQRLERNFPVYRLVQIGKRTLNRLVSREEA